MENRPYKDYRGDVGAPSGEGEEKDLRRIAGLVADLPDPEPPAGLVEAVMARLEPRRLGLAGRIGWRLRAPLALSPLKLFPLGAAAAAAVLFAVLFLPAEPERRPAPAALQGPSAEPARVVFTLDMPQASTVEVIGSFNGWRPGAFPMRWDETRRLWVFSLSLERGRHEYAFLVDGQRVVQDPGALLQQEDGFGNRNSVLIIEGEAGHEKKI